jgi:Xaa-Pro aminopeptidase
VSTDRSVRVRFPTPDAELERRWAAARSVMDEAGLDVLLAHGHVQGLGGYPKWFCDLAPADGYPVTVIFPRNRTMTLITHGPDGGDRALSPSDDPLLYGVERILSTWSFVSMAATATADARAAATALASFAKATIGLLGLAQLPHRFLEHLQDALPDARFVDAADAIDPVKAVKSAWEQAAIRRTVAMQVAAFEAALDAIAPGVHEWQVIDAARRVSAADGSLSGVYLIGSGPAGMPALPNGPRDQNRRLRAGDRLTILIEPSGPDGMFAELGRTVVLGAADDALHSEHALTVAAWRHCAHRLRPGARAADVFADYNAFLAAHDRPGERRLHCHGQGYDLVERPLVRSDESMTLAADQLIALHPMYVHDGAAHFLCDNVLIGPDGAGAPLHGVPQQIIEVACGS